MTMSDGAAKYNFNNFKEIKSHSSILYNERMAILFYLLDMKNLVLHKTRSIDAIYDVHSVLRQIYKNIRMLLRFNDTVRVTMNIETKDRGIYTIDIAMSVIDKMIKYCEQYGFTEKRLYIIIQELDNAEMVIKDILQYFHYFIRPDFSQKPDVETATEKYKDMADTRTVEELRELVGKNNKIDFQGLGSERIERNVETIEYNPETDGDLSEYMNEDDDELYMDDDEEDIEERE
jgi:hypothetical protein